MKMLNLHVWV
jgi:signal peptidase I